MIDSVHALGRPVYAWTINDRARMGQLLDQRVDAIMTDRPGLLREVFRERGLPTRQQRDDPRGPCVIEGKPLEDPPAGGAVPCGPAPTP